MQPHIIKFLAALALGAMLLTAFRPMSKGEHELVGNWQYVKSTVAIHWDDPAPFHDSAAQDEEKSERKDMTINADGSMTMVARDVEELHKSTSIIQQIITPNTKRVPSSPQPLIFLLQPSGQEYVV